MKRRARYAAFAVVLALTACLDRCRDSKSEQTAAVAGGGNAAAGSLILAARQQGAMLPPELADPRYADESTLPMNQFQLPATDFANAGTETEPNNTSDTATPLSRSFSVRAANSKGDYDYFVFETTGEPQLWAIEAVGKSIGNLLYETSGSGRVQAQGLDTGRFIIPSLFLAAGKHTIAVKPNSDVSGTYTLRAVALGKPDLLMEREPNDQPD